MRFLFAFVLVFSGFIGSSQEKSRIVFFRMDAEIGEKSKSFWEGRMYADDLFHDDTLITEMKSTSVFLVDGQNLSGTYYLVPRVSSSQNANRVKINPTAHSITFIKIKLISTKVITSYSEVISLDDFEKCYNKAKWLRKKLAGLGYGSVKELVDGYTISNKDSIQPRPKTKNYRKVVRRLNDTTWIDKRESATSRNSAYYYSIVKEEKPGYFSVNDYFTEGNKLKTTGHYSNIDSQTKTGTFLSYSKKGTLISKENYDNNEASGLWEYYYDTLNGPLWYTSNYKNGNRDGFLTGYYPSGKLKQTELHKVYFDTTYGRGRRKHQIKSIAAKDSIVEGHRYDEKGTEIKFTRFEQWSLPEYDYNEFLSAHIHYPSNALKKGIQGRVIVKFAVEADGTITNVTLYRGIYPELNNEAVRVVSLFPPWKPGYRDDKPVKIWYTLPIQFKLH